MPDQVAAAFSIGAQTTYRMLRTLNPLEGTRVLVTAAKSNTSLFVINALKKYNVNVYATSTSRLFDKELKEMGVKELIQVDESLDNFLDNEQMKALVSEIGGFDYVIDPFSDLFLGKVIDVMDFNARYITCGIHSQYFDNPGNKFQYRGGDLSTILTYTILKNIHIVGNCLGQVTDLSNAISDYVSGSLNVVIDSVFGGHQVGDFFARTYNARDRFGKVIYQYSDD
jgi:NADPH:quinone reductase-like Zn-dependent oxidoreductase